MDNLKYISLMIFLLGSTLFAQEHHHKHLTGKVQGIHLHEHHQDTIPLPGANLYWHGTTIGTMTDENGNFHLEKPEHSTQYLIVNYVSFVNDTIFIPEIQEMITISLNEIRETEGVTVEGKHAHHYFNETEVGHQRTISQNGLRTLACCNLSETFESTTDVEVEQTDAVSGAKRIKMLGLSGFYTQILIEKKPVVRGLMTPFSLDHIPGSWMQSIDISKGTASVMNGYESTTGQINVEFKKPENLDPVHLNLYQNSMGKSEGSLIFSKVLSEHLSTMVLGYGNFNRIKWDRNNDTFVDMPIAKQFNIMNRWKLSIPGKYDAQMGIKLIQDHRDGGQVDFVNNTHQQSNKDYGFHNQTNRYEFYMKAGKSFKTDQPSSIGLILSAYHHKQDAFWGMKSWEGTENSIHANLIYQKVMNQHKISTGFSYLWDDYEEYYNHQLFAQTEEVPGGFIEYTMKPSDKITSVMGIRYDNHNLFGDFITPRIHLKYSPSQKLTLKTSAGKGYRTPHLFVENLGILASSKSLEILEEPNAEEAWNYGLQALYNFTILHQRPATFIFDYYRTDFKNQLIVDLEQDVNSIFVYNLDGESFSNSAHVELNVGWTSKFETTVAWRWNDVKSTYQNQLRSVPLTSTNKGLFVFTYTTPNTVWQWDFTAQYNGKTRLPDTGFYPAEYQLREQSPAYGLLFTQLKRKFSNWEIYLGIENLTDYRQKDPILAWQDPFGPYFDSSLVWGPSIGRRAYIGIRIN